MTTRTEDGRRIPEGGLYPLRRRDLLARLPALAGLLAMAGPARAGPGRMPRMNDLTVEHFRPHVGAAFRIAPAAGEPFEAVLVEAAGLGPAPRAGFRAPFSLVFRAAGTAAQPQRMYRVERAGAGAWDIFLVPLGPDGDGVRYQAVFA